MAPQSEGRPALAPLATALAATPQARLAEPLAAYPVLAALIIQVDEAVPALDRLIPILAVLAYARLPPAAIAGRARVFQGLHVLRVANTQPIARPTLHMRHSFFCPMLKGTTGGSNPPPATSAQA